MTEPSLIMDSSKSNDHKNNQTRHNRFQDLCANLLRRALVGAGDVVLSTFSDMLVAWVMQELKDSITKRG